ncbi:MFS transporter [Actinomyces sp. B33]|uniref:MFS transporter n=1 Tax=Actinomyces sp. B33 TaxID=2942131 RepID=UPI0023420216|nr:MFS transporter [Actinomyces sp. B33]MDC4232914.1 MFS transporter [Actinomyces sp. B33]
MGSLPDGSTSSGRESTPEPEPLNSNSAFLHLWAGETASQIGFQVAALATSAMAITILHASTDEVGLLNALQTIAFLLIGLPAGAWVDRWRKRRTMIAADLVRVAALASVPIADMLGGLTLAHLMVVAAVMGLATVFFDVAYQSYVPVIVGPTQVGDANGRLEASFQIARIGGPGLGGWLSAVASAPLAYAATAGAYGFSALAVWRISEPEARPVPLAGTGLWRQIREGLDYVRSEPLLAPLFACISMASFFMQAQVVLVPVLVLRTLGMSASTLGGLLSLGAVGGLIGAIARPRIVRRLGEGRSIYLCNVIGVVASLGLPLSARAGSLAAAVIVAASVVGSFFLTIYNVTQMSLRQRLCPPELLGRLNATFRFAVWGMMPLGSLACGALAERMGVEAAMYVFTAGALVAGGLMALTPAARLGGDGDGARARALP